MLFQSVKREYLSKGLWEKRENLRITFYPDTLLRRYGAGVSLIIYFPLWFPAVGGIFSSLRLARLV